MSERNFNFGTIDIPLDGAQALSCELLCSAAFPKPSDEEFGESGTELIGSLASGEGQPEVTSCSFQFNHAVPLPYVDLCFDNFPSGSQNTSLHASVQCAATALNFQLCHIVASNSGEPKELTSTLRKGAPLETQHYAITSFTTTTAVPGHDPGELVGLIVLEPSETDQLTATCAQEIDFSNLSNGLSIYAQIEGGEAELLGVLTIQE